MRETTAAILEDLYEVEMASNGAEALRRVEQTHFDVIVSDYDMPSMSGMELLRHIRRLGRRPVTVLVTGMRRAVHNELGPDSDRADLVSTMLLKPYSPERLLEAIDRALTVAEMRNAVASAFAASHGIKRG